LKPYLELAASTEGLGEVEPQFCYQGSFVDIRWLRAFVKPWFAGEITASCGREGGLLIGEEGSFLGFQDGYAVGELRA